MFANRTLIGLDIGHHTVRAVALRRAGNRYQLLAHAAVQRRDGSGQTRPLALSLEELKGVMRLGAPAAIAVSDLSALVRYVATIPLPPDRLRRLLRLELLQHLDGAELAADTFPVPLVGDEIIHCCVLVQPTQVYEALKEIGSAGIRCGQIHFAPMAMYNATIVEPPVEDDAIALLVDIGAHSTGVALFGERRLLACRQLAIGGDTFTEALNAPGRTMAEAEELKLGAGASAGPAAAAGPAPSASAAAPPGRSGEEGPGGEEASRKDTATSISTGRLTAVSSTSLLLDDQEPLVLSEDVHQPSPKLLELEEASTEDLTIDAPWLNEDTPGATPFSSAATATAGAGTADPGIEDIASPGAATTTGPEGPARVDDLGSLLDEALPAPGMQTMAVAKVTLGPELTKAAEALYAQLASSVAWFKTQIKAKNLTISKVFIVGGGAGLRGLDGYLERRFGVPVRRLDPFAGIDGAQPERRHEWASAVGLALSSARGAVSLDLTPDRILVKQAWQDRLVWPFVAAACLLVAGFFACWTMLNEQGVDHASLDAYTAYMKEYDDLKAQLDGLQEEKAGLSEDLRSVASRLYAGRDLLYTVRALKERADLSRELWITRLETSEISQDAALKDPAAVTSVHRLAPAAPAAAKSGRKDTAIDRGGVMVSGLVKFDAAPTDIQLNKFFEDYMYWIRDWRPAPDAPKLFRDMRVILHLIQSTPDKTKAASAKDPTVPEGHFPFKLMYFFQPTELAQITAEQAEKAMPQQKPMPAALPAGAGRSAAATQPAAPARGASPASTPAKAAATPAPASIPAATPAPAPPAPKPAHAP